MRAGVALSNAQDTVKAVKEASAAVLAASGLGHADAALLFTTPDHAEALPAALDVAHAALGTDNVVGASMHGLLADGCELDSGPGVGLLAWSGLEAQPFLLTDVTDAEELAAEIVAVLGSSPAPGDLVVLLPDPSALELRALVAGLRERVAPAQLVGAGSAQVAGVPPLQWCRGELASGALAGMVLRAPRPARIGVTQACRPIGGLRTVTRAEGHWILELDGEPALDVYRKVARGPLAADLRHAAAFLLLAFPGARDAALWPGSCVVRHVVGFSPAKRGLAAPEPVARGTRIGFALREPEGAREDLKEMLAAIGPAPRGFGLYFDCCARGAALFGMAGLEAAYLRQAFGEAPVLGVLGSCEIGPIAGATELLTYTAVLALVDP